MYFKNKSVKVGEFGYLCFFNSILKNKWEELKEEKNFGPFREIIAEARIKIKELPKGEDGEEFFYFNSSQVTKWIYMIELYETALKGDDRDKKIFIAVRLLYKFLLDLHLNSHIRPDYLIYAYSRKLPSKDGVQGRKRHIDLTDEEREFINSIPDKKNNEVNETKLL